MRPAKLLTFAAACAVALPSAAATPPPAEAYGRLPAIGSAALSPDGKRVVLSIGYEYRASEPGSELTSLSVIDIDTGKAEATLAPSPKNILRGVGWADEKRPYYFISFTGGARDAMGGSYGGYAALAGATITPDRYACAVSVNGVSDPETMLKEVQRGGRKSMAAKWWGSSMGGDHIDHLRKISPLRQAAAVRVPLLLIHGLEDTVVPVDQSRSMNARLVQAKKDVRYVEIKGDDHWLSSASTRTQVLQEIDTFLATSLKR